MSVKFEERFELWNQILLPFQKETYNDDRLFMHLIEFFSPNNSNRLITIKSEEMIAIPGLVDFPDKTTMICQIRYRGGFGATEFCGMSFYVRDKGWIKNPWQLNKRPEDLFPCVFHSPFAVFVEYQEPIQGTIDELLKEDNHESVS